MEPPTPPVRTRTGAVFALVLAFCALPIVVAAKSRGPVELRNSVEVVGPASVKAFDVRLPADGLLDLEILVHQGNGVTLHVISRLSRIPIKTVNEFRLFPEFTLAPAAVARKTAWLPRGEYYVTVINQDPDALTKLRIFARFSPEPRPEKKVAASTD